MVAHAKIFGIPFTVCTLDEGIRSVHSLVTMSSTNMIVLANAHTMNLAFEQRGYREAIKNATIVFRDGTGVGWAMRKQGISPGHNFVGTDFVPELCRRNQIYKYRIFLLGANPGIAEEAAKKLKCTAPNISVVGVLHGYSCEEDNDAVVEYINRLHPDILLVAMGNPKQEIWIYDNRDRLYVPVCIGVGALFDYLSGNITRAPKWALNAGIEWIFRLILEPKRLWKRYLIGNFKFLIRVYREINKKYH